ncbi:MAG: AmmeMemoRadiSam system radical SAM enzyme [Endomicrobiales bacterium]|nr:AmmeMemoRadiSam system radical SAM enzyme [Endomicrobiales bacterium]
MFPALFYTKKDNKNVHCSLCPQSCTIAPGKAGICNVRKNQNGELFSLTYDEFTSINIDPIEKKPLYHFYPKSQILSVGTVGCNFKCGFCQNWEISQAKFGDIPTQKLTKDLALQLAKQHDSVGIAYTYNEPLINYEWILETAELFNKNGLKNVLVTNGYLNHKPWKDMLKFIDAANIDVKSFNENFYKSLCKGKLSFVLENVKTMVEMKKHVEITTLLIPGENDSSKEIEELTGWIAGLSEDIPLHFSRYYPQYHFDISPTDMSILVNAYNIARKKLKYVYLGNVTDSKYSQTTCPKCANILIERHGYNTKVLGLKNNTCAKCKEPVNIITAR